MLQRIVPFGLLTVALLALVSCGGDSSSSTTTKPVSGYANRIFLENSYFGTLIIMNGDTDQVFQSAISIAAGINLITESLDKTVTMVASPTTNAVYTVDNATESVATSVSLPSFTDSFSILPDNKTGIAAVRNAPVTNQSSGAVLLLDLPNSKVSATIAVPLVRFLSLNKARTKVLAFAENSNSLYVIDTTANTATAVPGFDRPVAAVFTSDDTQCVHPEFAVRNAVAPRRASRVFDTSE